MPRIIGTTLVPRNPAAKALQEKRGGAHKQSTTTVRQRRRQHLRQALDDWRDDLEFERRVSKR